LVGDLNKSTSGRWQQCFEVAVLDPIPGARPASAVWQPPIAASELVRRFVSSGPGLNRGAEPKRTWRIVSSEMHSTCWDGRETLFDLNFEALQVPPNRRGTLPMLAGRAI
jgi:hypothetical protein